MLTIEDVKAAQARLKGYVRRTPLIEAAPLKEQVGQYQKFYLKLENMQISGSFKARGAMNKVLSLPQTELTRGIVTASGGNHGLGVAYAGWVAHVPATIYLAYNTPPIKVQKLQSWGAKVVMEGEVWDDANRAALLAAEQDGLTYIHPFADEQVMAGQGTIGLEIVADAPDIDVLLVAIGGGGLISGVSFTAKTLKPDLQIIGVEPTGAPTLYESLKAGRVVELPAINTQANTLAPRRSDELNFEIIRQNVSEIVLVSDEEMREAAHWLWTEFGVAAELSGAAAFAALHSGKIQTQPSQKIGVLVCGAGTDGIY